MGWNVASMAYAGTKHKMIENGQQDPSGGEHLQVFCRECLGAVGGGGRASLAHITQQRLHETAYACRQRPLSEVESSAGIVGSRQAGA